MLEVTHAKVKQAAIPSRILAGVLAALLLVLGFLAADNDFHQSLHHSGKAASGTCVLCLFAKSQVHSPGLAPVAGRFVQCPFGALPRVESVVFLEFTYLASPGRAPPGLV
ncbi:MAG TPA: hypothetical protein VG167_12120 [Verrucomicrobiae bacterium]|nr:hypothetical protein [Verrucomicrobiae bacterium]